MITFEKSTSEIGEKLLVFFIYFFMKTLIKSIIYCQTVPLERLLMYVMKIVCQASLLSFLTWLSLEIACSAQHQLSLVENNLTGAYELRLMVVIELYVNATYYTQHPTLKLV